MRISRTRTSTSARVLIALALAATALPAVAASAAPVDGTFVVTTTADTSDVSVNGVCATAAGACSLRAAITEANAYAGPATIAFAIPGTGPFEIRTTSRLPELVNSAGTTIDGYTQPGASPNTAEHGSNARILVNVRGAGAAAYNGLNIKTADNTVRGLALYDFRVALFVSGLNMPADSVTRNRIVGNFVCTDSSATFTAPAVNGGAGGVVIKDRAPGNRVGSAARADRNVVSGCAHRGINISYAGSNRNVVQGNLVGLSPDGSRALANRAHGIDVNYAAQDNLIGGAGPGEGNVSSGNVGSGVEISHGAGNRRNDVIGNSLGTDITGTTAPAHARNQEYGINLEGDYPCSTTCPPNAGYSEVAQNTIVNNTLGGIQIDKGQQRNDVHDNRIGVLPDGTAAGNAGYAIRIEHGTVGNTIGPRNVIAHNARGIQLLATASRPPSSTEIPSRLNTITQNSMYANGGLGIDAAALGAVGRAGATNPDVQDGIAIPVVTRATRTAVVGTACASCRVEVFVADRTIVGTGTLEDHGDGRTYLGTAQAGSNGAWSLATVSPVGRVVTATATDSVGNTSEFARNGRVS